jgi:hypothetical protein
VTTPDTAPTGTPAPRFTVAHAVLLTLLVTVTAMLGLRTQHRMHWTGPIALIAWVGWSAIAITISVRLYRAETRAAA